MGKIIRHSRFISNPWGDGGAKRSAQIEELLQKNGLAYENEDFSLAKTKDWRRSIFLFIKGIRLTLKEFSLAEIRSVSNLISMSKYFGLRIPSFEKYRTADVVFLNEDTTPGAYGYPYLAKSYGKSIIGVPHNLESLAVQGNDLQSGKPRLKWLFEDIKRFGLCDAVFCISKEETWLLQVFGVNAHYLPYYPPHKTENHLLSIREKRMKRLPIITNHFLLLGSATNPPTRQGMEDLLGFLSRQKSLPFYLDVAGYKTESLKCVSHPNIRLHGTVSDEQLESLLVETDGLIISQPPTSGALTRIEESLIAGIPIFASFSSARDYFQEKDIQIFDSYDDLLGLLNNSEYRIAAKPTRNTSAEHIFAAVCKTLSKQF